MGRRWAVVALMAALGVPLYFAAQWWRAAPNSEPLRALPLTSLSGAVRAPSLSPDGNYVAFTWSGP
jgi:hypothetical protein